MIMTGDIISGEVAGTPGSSNDSTIWNFTIPPGQTFLIPQDGTSFEFTVQTGAVAVRRNTGKFSSQYNEFVNGTGVHNVKFSTLEVKNLSATVAVVCQMIVGSANFINHTQIVIAGGIGAQNVVLPAAPAVGATNINFKDVSGSAFTDINGGKWLAIARAAIVICNTDPGATYLLQKSGATGPAAPAVAAIFPLTSFIEQISGDYTLNVGGAGMNAIAHEVYQAIPQT